MLAIAIPFGAITAKVYAEILDEAAGGAHEAIVTAGGGRLGEFVRRAHSDGGVGFFIGGTFGVSSTPRSPIGCFASQKKSTALRRVDKP